MLDLKKLKSENIRKLLAQSRYLNKNLDFSHISFYKNLQKAKASQNTKTKIEL